MMENQPLLAALLPSSNQMDLSQLKVENGGESSEKIKISDISFQHLQPINSVSQIVSNSIQEPNEKKSRGKKKEKKSDFVNSVLGQDNDNVIGFFESVDPMLAWALLKSKILPHVGNFDMSFYWCFGKLI